MNQSDIAVLMRGAAPAIRDLVEAAVRPLLDRVNTLEADLREARAALVEPKDGESVTVEQFRPMVEETVSAAISEALRSLPTPKDGEPGAPGKLPIAKVWTDGVHYEGDVVTLDGSTYQASVDTGKAPPHADWICLASAGRNGEDGADGRSLCIRGTYIDIGEYLALDVVALNGASFVAKKDDPGQCPGEGWQLIAAQGKRGAPGEGRAGPPGRPGDTGEAVVAAAVDEQGLLTLINGDGTKVQCDLYPVLSKIGAPK